MKKLVFDIFDKKGGTLIATRRGFGYGAAVNHHIRYSPNLFPLPQCAWTWKRLSGEPGTPGRFCLIGIDTKIGKRCRVGKPFYVAERMKKAGVKQ